jgi:uncharacterized protein
MDRVSDEVEERPAWDSGGPAVLATLERMAEKGIDPELVSEIVTSVARIAADSLAEARGLSGVIQTMRGVVGLAGQVVRGARDDAQRRKLPVAPTACNAGCSHCCKLHVSLSAPEAIVLAAFLTDTLKPADLAALTTRVEAMASRVATMDHDQRMEAGLDCSLLVDGRCIAYPVRPLACAAANSLDADACARGKEIPIEAQQLCAIHATQIGLAVASAARALDYGRYELNNALAVALGTPDAADRWLAGERLFVKTPGDPTLGEATEAFAARDKHLKRASVFTRR